MDYVVEISTEDLIDSEAPAYAVMKQRMQDAVRQDMERWWWAVLRVSESYPMREAAG